MPPTRRMANYRRCMPATNSPSETLRAARTATRQARSLRRSLRCQSRSSSTRRSMPALRTRRSAPRRLQPVLSDLEHGWRVDDRKRQATRGKCAAWESDPRIGRQRRPARLLQAQPREQQQRKRHDANEPHRRGPDVDPAGALRRARKPQQSTINSSFSRRTRSDRHPNGTHHPDRRKTPARTAYETKRQAHIRVTAWT